MKCNMIGLFAFALQPGFDKETSFSRPSRITYKALKKIKGTRLLVVLIISIWPFHASSAPATEMILDLRGFRIGQYREAPKSMFGEPMQKGKYQDGYEYEVYLVDSRKGVYMVFEYSPSNLNVIWSIQFAGDKAESGLKNLTLGADKSKVIEVLGIPTNKEDIGENEQEWKYDQTNYSIEINKNGKLSSVKITDESAKLFPKLGLSHIPKFGQLVKVLMSKDPNKIGEWLCPDVEVTYAGSIHFFKSSWSTEIKSDASGVFKLLADLSADLNTVDTTKSTEYEENLSESRGHDPLHVIKIYREKGIKEIVLKYRFGKYLIWEIKALE